MPIYPYSIDSSCIGPETGSNFETATVGLRRYSKVCFKVFLYEDPVCFSAVSCNHLAQFQQLPQIWRYGNLLIVLVVLMPLVDEVKNLLVLARLPPLPNKSFRMSHLIGIYLLLHNPIPMNPITQNPRIISTNQDPAPSENIFLSLQFMQMQRSIERNEQALTWSNTGCRMPDDVENVLFDRVSTLSTALNIFNMNEQESGLMCGAWVGEKAEEEGRFEAPIHDCVESRSECENFVIAQDSKKVN
ncbi:uncharacterized protein MYCFIDRAFT_175867 [Pseudocercospora fijiensis CIRAD86]|uniref:Uncharacterized protein n=1 Tax=Pseudocercospora fijiensis (strain CIRAD86) TaxID=383855 RepID=M2ZTJ5_PSEFD|nr:uncharacterized protein MYCFIDRAFT_175867 [Pseudocercospora fijiensis CIRAD86]EME82324.1 hypothetical protein MYCFIDRAFT_175867 [Pseudocercospora fijiensis CIRAD86]